MMVVSELTDLKPICNDVLNHLGVSLVSEAGHGKSYLAFQLVKEFNRLGIPVYIYSPSNIWLKKFGQIEYITVGNRYYNPIIKANDNLAIYRGYSRDTIQINLDKKWRYVSNGWLENRLNALRSTLFNIRYLNGRRIKYFIGTALKIQYLQQKRLQNPQPIIVVLEEAQNPFGTFSMNDDLSLELMTVFTQSRTDSNIHYIVIGQRLNDISTKIVERLRPIIGYTIGQNALRKIKAQLPKHLKSVPQTLQPQTWLYLNGQDNPIFKSPRHQTKGKPIRLKIPPPKTAQQNELWRNSILKPKPKRSLWQRFLGWLFPKPIKIKPLPTTYNNTDNNEEDISEEHAGLLASDEEEETEALYWG